MVTKGTGTSKTRRDGSFHKASVVYTTGLDDRYISEDITNNDGDYQLISCFFDLGYVPRVSEEAPSLAE